MIIFITSREVSSAHLEQPISREGSYWSPLALGSFQVFEQPVELDSTGTANICITWHLNGNLFTLCLLSSFSSLLAFPNVSFLAGFYAVVLAPDQKRKA